MRGLPVAAVISPPATARQPATVTVSHFKREILRVVSGTPVHGFNACARDYATVFTPVNIPRRHSPFFPVFFHVLSMRYMIDGDWNSFWRTPFVFIQLPRLSLAPCTCRLYTRLLAVLTMQARSSNANLEITSPVHNAAKNFRRNIRACIYPVTSEVTQINTCAVS
jgi:hypothetical protein